MTQIKNQENTEGNKKEYKLIKMKYKNPSSE